MVHPFWVMCLAASSLSILAQAPAGNQEPGLRPPPMNEEPAAVTVQAPRLPLPPPKEASALDLEKAGDELRSKKAYTDALEYYAAAVKKADSPELHNKIGIAHLQLLQLKAAEKEFSRAVKMNRSYAEALNNLGVVYYMRKKYDKAIREYQKALELSQVSASFHSNLGMAYFEKKTFDKATEQFLRALELDPQIFERQSLGGIAARMASPEDRARYAYTLARIYAGRGIYDRSLEYLKKAVEEGYPQIKDVYQDDAFAGLRKDPRFAVVMAKTEPLPN
ncbi:MAG TPA: tetratricopeptide repeat protein [Terriglobales bacterium]|jgi:tetratricopeptide (TPR) repeat protein|nr:tetratricopeptide repeat protein [Terriglobales bacterium]